MLLHTFAHMLIRQMSFSAGYSSSSLRERLYAADASDGPSMAGILVYTAAGDSEGTLGGLARLGEAERLVPALAEALASAQWCSLDPVCREATAQGPEGLSLAACHACVLVSETSCVMGNVLLDRRLVLDEDFGFFRGPLSALLRDAASCVMFQLPSYNDLSGDEDGVLVLPVDDSAVVVGGPGTGKTLMALYRAKLMYDLGRPTFLLMYNRLLSSYTKAALDSLSIGSVVDTYHHWFPIFWKQHYGVFPPKIDRWTFDWSECKQTLMFHPMPTAERRHLIVDEGQDLPTDLYLLLKMMSRSLVVFADQNQRISAHQSTIAEIQAATGIELVVSLRAEHAEYAGDRRVCCLLRRQPTDRHQSFKESYVRSSGCPG